MKNLVDLRNELKNQNSKNSKSQKVGINAYFAKVLKENVKMTKEELIDEVVLEIFVDKFNEDLTVENLRKRKVEIEELKVTINNSIDTSKSNTTTKGYISGSIKDQKLFKNNKNEYYLELVK
jgi:hypothetical protein